MTSQGAREANVKEDSPSQRHLSTGEENARTCSVLPRHDPVDVALVEECGGVAAAVAAPVPVVAALVAVAAAGAGGVAALAAAAHQISRIQIWRGESLTPPSQVSSLFLVSVAFPWRSNDVIELLLLPPKAIAARAHGGDTFSGTKITG